MRNRSSAAGLALLVAAVLDAADPAWRSKPISQWTVEEAKQVLATSPWAKATAVALLPKRSEDQLRDGGRMGGGGRGWLRGDSASTGRGEHTVVQVRWESALPVRAAEVKAGEIGAPDWEGDYYAIAVYDVPGVTPAVAKGLPGQLKQVTALKREGRKDLKPARVEIELAANDLARILYLFPRSAQLTLEDGRIEFVSQVGRIFVAQFFDSAEMQFAGQPGF